MFESQQDISKKTYEAAKFFIENGFKLIALNSTDKDRKCTCGKKTCSSPGKHPRFRSNWKVSATNDLIKVESWLKKSKEPINLAVATGRKSDISKKYLIVVDVDTISHPIMDILPKTFSYRTGSGGHHLWYWSNIALPNSVSALADKVDIRGTNGYVVVPPSSHVSGRTYEFNCESDKTHKIMDLPHHIISLVKSLTATTKKEGCAKKKHAPKTKTSECWPTLLPVKEIRALLEQGKKIPNGARNSTIHRLLSSDRAKGAQETRLKTQALCYKLACENYIEINQGELDKIINSVLKYPCYDTSFDKVNERFFDWKKQSGKIISKDKQQQIIDLDNDFFQNLTLSQGTCTNKTLVPLSVVIKAREDFFRKNDQIDGIPKYRPQLMAKKLESLGFTRSRTSKGNLWDVDITRFTTLQSPEDVLSSSKKKQYMLQPQQEIFLNMTVKIAESNTFKVTRKDHPNERMYLGRATMETQGALNQALECLSSEEFDKLALGTLIYDEESTAELFDSIQVGDVIGLCGLEPRVGWTSHQWEVLSIEKDLDMLKCKQRHPPHKEKIITFEDVSIGLLLGRGEILLRDGKPYGLSEDEQSYNVSIVDLSKEKDEKDSQETTAPVEVVPEAIQEVFEMTEEGVFEPGN